MIHLKGFHALFQESSQNPDLFWRANLKGSGSDIFSCLNCSSVSFQTAVKVEYMYVSFLFPSVPPSGSALPWL